MIGYYSDEYSTLEHGLIGHWRPSLVENVTGTVLFDISGNNNHCTLQSGFDANNDFLQDEYGRYLNCRDVTTRSGITSNRISWASMTGWTMSAWFYPTSNSLTRIFFANRTDASAYGPVLRTSGSNVQMVTSLGDTLVVSTAGNMFQLNTWNFIAAWWDIAFGAGEIYINGTRVVGNNSQTFDYSVLTIGATEASGSRFLGRLDDLRVYNRILSLDEIVRMHYAKRIYDMSQYRSKRRSVSIAAGFKAYWHRRQQQIIGGGLR